MPIEVEEYETVVTVASCGSSGSYLSSIYDNCGIYSGNISGSFAICDSWYRSIGATHQRR